MKRPRAWTTAHLVDDLLGRLWADRWLAVSEATLERGQRADVLAMRRKFHTAPMLIFEVKTDRADLLSDLRSDKWRGYLASGAVAFAFPAGIADLSELPPEVGVYMRVAQGWSWKRGPRLLQAPPPSDYLFRRLAMTVADQVERRVDARYRQRAGLEFGKAKNERHERARQVMRALRERESLEKSITDSKNEYDKMFARLLDLEMKIEDAENQLTPQSCQALAN